MERKSGEQENSMEEKETSILTNFTARWSKNQNTFPGIEAADGLAKSSLSGVAGMGGECTLGGQNRLLLSWAKGGSVVKNLPANTGDAGSVLEGEDTREEEVATHSSIFAWRIPWIEEPGRLQYMRLRRVRHDRATENPSKLSQSDPDEQGKSSGGRKGK